MRAYKHTHPDHAADFLSGAKIRLGTFSGYRQQEGARGDPLEGSAMRIASPVKAEWDGPSSERTHTLDRLRHLGILFEDGGKKLALDVQGNTLTVRLPEALVFCASVRPDPEQGEVLRISKFAQFAVRLTEAIPLRVGHPVCGVVRYQERIADVMHQDPYEADPFVKSPDFRWENEVRAIWPLERDQCPPPDGHIFVNCPAVSELIKRC